MSNAQTTIPRSFFADVEKFCIFGVPDVPQPLPSPPGARSQPFDRSAATAPAAVGRDHAAAPAVPPPSRDGLLRASSALTVAQQRERERDLRAAPPSHHQRVHLLTGVDLDVPDVSLLVGQEGQP